MQDTMVYKVNDMPPPAPLLVLSLQHMLFMFAASAFPAMLVREIGGDLEMAASLVSLTMIMAGIGSIMQASHIKYIGSGYLCPNLCGPSYLTASLHAAWIGGIPLMRGMVLFSGLIEMGLAPMVKKLKFMFPPIIVGLVVAMVGVSVVSIAAGNFFGVAYSGDSIRTVSYTHLRAHETVLDLVCRLLLEKYKTSSTTCPLYPSPSPRDRTNTHKPSPS